MSLQFNMVTQLFLHVTHPHSGIHSGEAYQLHLDSSLFLIHVVQLGHAFHIQNMDPNFSPVSLNDRCSTQLELTQDPYMFYN
jgi:hypothetical protein